MKAPALPRPEAGSALLLLLLLCGALLGTAARPGPGPLPIVLQVAIFHATLLAPALSRGHWAYAALSIPLALPAMAATSYGHDRLGPAVLLLVAACAAGAAGRALRRRAVGSLYLPGMLLVLFAPYALHYLVVEFGVAAGAEPWLLLSPMVAAQRLALPRGALLLLLFWPVLSLIPRRVR